MELTINLEDIEMAKKARGCPLLIQSDTFPSRTVAGEAHTRTFMLSCIEDKCMAYRSGICEKWGGKIYYEEAEAGNDT